jgi:hypothetical protein
MNIKATIWAISLAWLGSQLMAAALARSLYGDGGWYVLIHLLTPHQFNDYDFHRSFASFMTQAPLLLGQRLGAESVASYAALYSLGTFVFPAALFIYALYLAQHQGTLFSATSAAIIVFGFGVNFINSEVNLFFALVWLAVVMLSLQGVRPLLRGFALPIVAFTLTRVYEGMLLMGPLLALWALVAFNRTDNHQEKIGLSFAGILFVLGAATGLTGFLAPRDPSNASDFVATSLAYLRSPQVWLLLSVTSVLSAIRTAKKKRSVALILAGLLFAALFLLAIIDLDGYYSYSIYYYNRSFLVFLLPIAVAVLFVRYYRRAKPELGEGGGGRFSLILIPFAVAIGGDVLGTYRWHTYVDTFCRVLEADIPASSGVAVLKQSGAKTGWLWTHPALSVLLRDRGSRAMVRNEMPERWQPFDPAKAITLNYLGLCQAPLWREPRLDPLRTPISFRDAKYPNYVASVRGLSNAEGWAAWSDANTVEVHFREDLPQSFDMILNVASAFGSNRGAEIPVMVGARRQSFVTRSEPYEVTMSFSGVGRTRTITIEIPKPESPTELGISADNRRLGIALISMTIVPR